MLRAMNRFSSASLILACCVLGSGCSVPLDRVSTSPNAEVSQAVLETGEWKAISEGIERRVDQNIASSTVTLILYRFAADQFELTFASATGAATVHTWRERVGEDAIAIMNAAYFDENFMPVGFLMKNGTRIGNGMFDLDKSGFLVGGTKPRVIEISDITTLAYEKEVIQSFPFLVERGAASVKEDSGKKARRSFVGTDVGGNFYLGIALEQLGEDAISLFQLSQYLSTMNVKWNNVLNLDGGPSTGFSVASGAWQEEINSVASVPSILVVKRKI